MNNPHPVFGYMLPPKEQVWITEDYVSSPPALIITDETGAIWTLANDIQAGPTGEYAFSVLRNGRPVGEIASRIERRKGKIRVFTASGWKLWNGKSFF